MIQSTEESYSYNDIPPELLKAIKLAFNFFDTNGTGKINPKEIKSAMEYLKQDDQNPTVYQLISLLSESEDSDEGITLDEFIKSIYKKLGDNKSNKGIKRLFEMFKDDPNIDSIDLDSLKKISQQLEENLSDEDLEEMMQRISKGQNRINFQQFCNIIMEK